MPAQRDPKTGRFPKRPEAPKGGTGWGGGAKGASASRIAPGDAGAHIRALAHDPANKAAKAALAERYLNVLDDVAMNGDADTARLMAADKALDRVLGKALAKVDVTTRDLPAEQLTDDELAAIARRGGGASPATPGDAPQP